MRVRFPLPAPRIFTAAKARAENSLSRRRITKPDKQRLGVRRSWRAGADCKSVGLSLSWFESSHSHQNKNTRVSGVFILVKCGIGFESRNHLIAGSTMSCCVARCAWHTTYECPAVPRHQRGRGNQPLPPLKKPPNGGFFILIFLRCQYMCG